MARQRHTVPVGGPPVRPESLSAALAAASQGLPEHELKYIQEVLVPRILANVRSRGMLCCLEPATMPEEGEQSDTTESEDRLAIACPLSAAGVVSQSCETANGKHRADVIQADGSPIVAA
ncbi:MAG: hypothetical protein J5I93_26250 [Pirellulaceae bacterium]|nr:hypothetical protein [Pirellulaceae bacterium]